MGQLDFDRAIEYVRRAREIGRARGANPSVAVLDAAGHPIALAGSGNGRPGVEFAMGKARLAAAFRRPTRELADEWKERPLYAASLMHIIPGGITVNLGGYPIVVDGEVVGAIGVTGGGGGPDGDDEVARLAAAWNES